MNRITHEFGNIQLVLEHWIRLCDIYVPKDLIRMLIRYRGQGEILAIDSDGQIFVAELNIDKKQKSLSDTLKNSKLEWKDPNLLYNNSQSDSLSIGSTRSGSIPVLLYPHQFTLAMAPHNGVVYRIGGGFPDIDNCYKFDLSNKTSQWEPLQQPMFCKRSSTAAFCLNNDCLIVVGGNRAAPSDRSPNLKRCNKSDDVDNNCNINDLDSNVIDRINQGIDTSIKLIEKHKKSGMCQTCCEMYDNTTKRWKLLTPCNEQRVAPIGVGIDNNIGMIIGGTRDKNTTIDKFCEIYNFEMNKWEYTTSMKNLGVAYTSNIYERRKAIQMYGFGAVSWNNKVYIAGGSGMDLPLCFDVISNKWKTLAPLKRTHSDAVAGVYNGLNCIFVKGKNVSVTEMYDSRSGKWMDVADAKYDDALRKREFHPLWTKKNSGFFKGKFIALS